LLGYNPQTEIRYDVGLNHLIGKKFPLKRWPEAQWQSLYDKLSPQYSVNWQQGNNDIDDYIEWIASCRVLVTNDSLGLHIALALDKPVIALFGPTIATEVAGERLIKIRPPLDWDCIPCLESFCPKAEPCIAYISVESVQNAISKLITEPLLSSSQDLP
jgi:heptosyltransferase-2